MKVRANQLKVGQIFKTNSPISGTNTYKVLSGLRRYLRNEYIMDVELIETTQPEWNKLGKDFYIFGIRYNKFKEVKLMK